MGDTNRIQAGRRRKTAEHFFFCSPLLVSAVLVVAAYSIILTLFPPPPPSGLALVTISSHCCQSLGPSTFLIGFLNSTYPFVNKPLSNFIHSPSWMCFILPANTVGVNSQWQNRIASHGLHKWIRLNWSSGLNVGTHDTHGQEPGGGKGRPLETTAFLHLSLMTCLSYQAERITLEQMKQVGWHKKRAMYKFKILFNL